MTTYTQTLTTADGETVEFYWFDGHAMIETVTSDGEAVELAPSDRIEWGQWVESQYR